MGSIQSMQVNNKNNKEKIYINNQKLKGLIENKQGKYEKPKVAELLFYSIRVSVFKL